MKQKSGSNQFYFRRFYCRSAVSQKRSNSFDYVN